VKNQAEKRNRAVLVTGCSSGIGRAVAVHLARNGYTVFAAVRREEDRRSLEALSIDRLIGVCPMDMTRPDEIGAAVAAVSARIGAEGLSLYAVVNNAGGGAPAPAELIDPEMLRRETAARIVGPVVLLQETLPLLRAGNGRIVWIVTPAILPTPYVAAIHACDFAVNCLARTLDIELKRWNIQNIMIRCGGIRTPAGLRTLSDVERLLESSPPARVQLYAKTLKEWAADMAAFDSRRTPAERVAEVVSSALKSSHPRRRYAVGHMSRLAAFLELLPQPLADHILKLRF